MTQEQLSLWDLLAKEDKFLWAEVLDIKERQNNLRKGIFKRYDDLWTEIEKLREEIASMKRGE